MHTFRLFRPYDEKKTSKNEKRQVKVMTMSFLGLLFSNKCPKGILTILVIIE
jgi:hypothetical protein